MPPDHDAAHVNETTTRGFEAPQRWGQARGGWYLWFPGGALQVAQASRCLTGWAAPQASRSSLPATAEPEQEAGELDKKPSVAAEKGSIITEQQREQLEQ